MRYNEELRKILLGKLQYHRDSVPVFRIRQQNATELHNESVKLALPFTGCRSAKEFRYDTTKTDTHTRLRLQENASLHYYHASGFTHFRRNTPPFANIVSDNAEKADVARFRASACDLLEKSQLNREQFLRTNNSSNDCGN